MTQELRDAAKAYKDLWLPDDHYDAFIAGATWQAKRMYTEEDMRKAWVYGRANYDWDNTFEQWIEKTNQYPTEFETMDEYPVITDDDYFLKEEKSISKPKTITTAQGIQWVGKYK